MTRWTQLELEPPRPVLPTADPTRMARTTDPSTSHLAAEKVLPSMADLDTQILGVVSDCGIYPVNPLSAFEIARTVTGTWKESTVRTRVSALAKHPDGFLEVADELGREGRCSVRRYRLRNEGWKQ